MSRHERLLSNAKSAIDELFGDTSVTKVNNG